MHLNTCLYSKSALFAIGRAMGISGYDVCVYTQIVHVCMWLKWSVL